MYTLKTGIYNGKLWQNSATRITKPGNAAAISVSGGRESRARNFKREPSCGWQGAIYNKHISRVESHASLFRGAGRREAAPPKR